jgi:hypothetical protein
VESEEDEQQSKSTLIKKEAQNITYETGINMPDIYKNPSIEPEAIPKCNVSFNPQASNAMVEESIVVPAEDPRAAMR